MSQPAKQKVAHASQGEVCLLVMAVALTHYFDELCPHLATHWLEILYSWEWEIVKNCRKASDLKVGLSLGNLTPYCY